MMGRLLFAVVLGVVGLMYIAAATMSVMDGGFLKDQWLGAILFLVIGAAAAVASFNLLREKRR